VSSNPVLRGATYEDLLKVPENLVAELIDGELYTWPRPAAPHARAAMVLSRLLFGPFDDGDGGPGGWWIVIEPELHLGKQAMVPDLAGWRRERMPEYPDTSGCTVAPDWLCEIQSPSNARYDRVVKLPHYAKHGVAYAWMINTADKTLEVLRLEDGRWIVAGNYGGDDVVRAEPFDAVELNLAALWLP
jgi:Uma2 family endonuclease